MPFFNHKSHKRKQKWLLLCTFDTIVVQFYPLGRCLANFCPVVRKEPLKPLNYTKDAELGMNKNLIKKDKNLTISLVFLSELSGFNTNPLHASSCP